MFPWSAHRSDFKKDSSVTINSKRVVSKRSEPFKTPFLCTVNAYTKGKCGRYVVYLFFTISAKIHPGIRLIKFRPECHNSYITVDLASLEKNFRQFLKLCVICLTFRHRLRYVRGLYSHHS